MATKGQNRAARSRAALRLQLSLGLTLVGGLGGLAGCDDRLPGFADPPPADAGGDAGGDGDEDDDGGRAAATLAAETTSGALELALRLQSSPRRRLGRNH